MNTDLHITHAETQLHITHRHANIHSYISHEKQLLLYTCINTATYHIQSYISHTQLQITHIDTYIYTQLKSHTKKHSYISYTCTYTQNYISHIHIETVTYHRYMHIHTELHITYNHTVTHHIHTPVSYTHLTLPTTDVV